MKQAAIVGLGMNAATLTGEGRQAVEEAEVLLGAARLLEVFAPLGKPAVAEHRPQAVARLLESRREERFCVLVSGDTGFYSAAEGLYAALQGYSPRMIPGVSSLSYFFARLGRPWQDAALVSRHGRQANWVDTVRRNPLTFALTGGDPGEMGAELDRAGLGGGPRHRHHVAQVEGASVGLH
jgi:precorrin-6Y C5,15-methyltransferase (decarboxylating)